MLDELAPVDLVVMGCVAVGEDGARLGKGGGFADLEYARARPGGPSRPEAGIAWDDLTEEKIAAIPLLSALRAARG